MPSSWAMPSSGLSSAARAMSRSLGVAMLTPLDSGGCKAVDLDAEFAARRQQLAEQVRAGGAIAVRQVGGHVIGVVTDHVGGHRGDVGPEGGPVRGDAFAGV